MKFLFKNTIKYIRFESILIINTQAVFVPHWELRIYRAAFYDLIVDVKVLPGA